MKSFDRLVKESLDLGETIHGDGTYNVFIIFTYPNFVAWFRDVYYSTGPLKYIIKNQWKKCLMYDWHANVKTMIASETALEEEVSYVLSHISSFEHTMNLRIQRWAIASKELLVDTRVFKIFAYLIDQNEQLKAFVKSSLSYMTSECIQHKHIFAPYDVHKALQGGVAGLGTCKTST